MSRQSIHFFSEDIAFTLKNKTAVRSWITKTISLEKKKLKELSLIFCSDEYLLAVNRQYLQHDTYTDIITFDYGESDTIAGDIFISIERIKENAARLQLSETDELHRVIIHGVLHLLGYKDKSPAEKSLMTAKEDHYLAQRTD